MHNRRRLDNTKTKGFTLIEMLVTVTVLVIIIGSFSVIIGEAQDLVMTSQGIMKANARATALAGILREDIARVSRLGFLYVNGSRMYIGVPGPCKSVVSREMGNGCIISLSRDTSNSTIGRGQWMFTGKSYSTVPADVFWDGSNYSPDFTELQTASESQLTAGGGGSPNFIDRMNMFVISANDLNPNAAATLDEINALWPLLAEDCTALTIEALDDSLAPIGGTGNGTWTKNDDDWPAAIRITMTLTDPELLARADAESAGSFSYEIICPVRP